MNGNAGRRVAKLRTELTIPTIEALEPAARPWIAWDDKVTGFGVRVQRSGAKSFIVNFRAGKGGPLKRMVIARVGEMLPGQARQRARAIIERAARGQDPEKVREAVLAVPTLEEVFEAYMAADEGRSPRTVRAYRYDVKRYLGDWLARPLDSIDAEDVKDRFERITDNHGWSPANRAMSLLRSLYRKPCADIETLHNPVSLWLAGGGRFHSKPRRQISSPSEILPRWRAGIEAEVDNAVIRDAFWFATFTGLLREEVLTLNWEHVDSAARTFRVRHARGALSAELPITAQLAAILDSRHAECGRPEPGRRAWGFPFPVADQRLRPSEGNEASVPADIPDGRREILVPGNAQLLSRRRRARTAAAILAHQPASQPRAGRRNCRRSSRRLDHRTASTTRSAHRQQDRGIDKCPCAPDVPRMRSAIGFNAVQP